MVWLLSEFMITASGFGWILLSALCLLRRGYGHTGNPTDTQADVRNVLKVVVSCRKNASALWAKDNGPPKKTALPKVTV